MGQRDTEIARLNAEITSLSAENDQDYQATMVAIEKTKEAAKTWAEQTISKAEVTLTVAGKKEKLVVEGPWSLRDLARMKHFLAVSIDQAMKAVCPAPSGPTTLELTNDLRRRIDARKTKLAALGERVRQLRVD